MANRDDRHTAAKFYRPCGHSYLMLCAECAAELVAAIREASEALYAAKAKASIPPGWKEAK